MAGMEAAGRPAVRRPGRPAPRQRPLRGARLDARDDGHDPQPRPQRRDHRRACAASGEPGVRRQLPARFEAMFRDVVGVDAVRTTRGRSSGPRSRPSSAPGTATGRSLPRARGHPGRPGHRPSPSRRWSSATAAPTPEPACCSRAIPATGEPILYGDVLFNAQGEDVVAGTHATEPIAVLDERLPAVAAELRDARRAPRAPPPRPVRHRVHDRARAAVDAPVPDRQAEPAGGARGSPSTWPRTPAFPLTRADAVQRVAAAPRRSAHGDARGATSAPPLATGLPASPGVAGGEIVTSPEAAVSGRRAGPDRHPRPGRDLARRRPRHGRGGRHPDRHRRARQPRRRRRPRLGDPGRRRGGRGRGRRAGSSIGGRTLRRPARRSRSTAGPARSSRAPWPGRPRSCPRRRTLLPGRASSGSRSARDGRAAGGRRGRDPGGRAASSGPVTIGRRPRGPRGQGLRDAAEAIAAALLAAAGGRARSSTGSSPTASPSSPAARSG